MINKESPSTLEQTADTFGELTLNKNSFSESEELNSKGDSQFASERADDYRSPHAHKEGGFTCKDDKQVDKLRSVGKEMVKLIGRRILSGELNLTKISFPARACSARTALQNSVQSCIIFPHFINRAAYCSNSLERFKLTCVAILASSSYVDMFLKPLNPIIGETLQACLKDGTKVYCQQISHHPPISYFLIYGPNNCYQFSGFYNFDVSPGLNSLSLKNKGQRKFLFKDGTQIVASYASGVFSNTFFGTSRVEQAGECEITDTKNGYKLKIEFGKMKKKSSDYFQSMIKKDGKQIEQIFGTYCGFIEINKKRYWDIRDFQPFELDYENIPEFKLKSNFSYRKDLQLINEDKMEEAQKAKEELEEIQRTDQKMRKKYRAAMKQSHHN